MKYRLLNFLCCPYCQQDLSLKKFEGSDQEIVEGILLCPCGKIFPIVNSIPRIFSNALKENRNFIDKYFNYFESYLNKVNEDFSLVNKEEKNKKSFEFEWLNYDLEMGDEKRIFLEETRIPDELWKNKLVLDVGCGMGRYTRIPAGLSAEVIGIDLGLSVEKAFEKLQSFQYCHIVQANLMAPPFKEKTFDIVYSLGVLHHTSNTKTAFNKIAKLVKEDGIVSIWVYGKAGRYKDFVTNPLRTDRKKFAKVLFSTPLSYLFWIAVKMREAISNLLRVFTIRMPIKVLYYFCHILSFLGKIPLIKYLTFSVLKDWRGRVWENFDWLSPQFQHHHTKEKVISWFKEEGFSDLNILPHGLIPKAGVKGRKSQI